MDANDLWHIMIPVQILGLIANIAVAVLLGMFAIKHGAGQGKGEEITVDEKAQQEEEALRRPKLLIFNLVLTVALLAVLSTGVVTSYVAFLVALSIGLAVNYPDLKLQDKLIKKHAPAALMISATLFSAGAMVGVFDGTRNADRDGKCHHLVCSQLYGPVPAHHLWHSGSASGPVHWHRCLLLRHHAAGH